MPRHSLGRSASTWVVGAQIVLMFTLSTLPTPLYADYANAFHLSSLALTMIFAAYVIGTLSTLLFLGRLSDEIGRRRVSLAAVAFGVAAALLFILAKDSTMLLAARVVSGIATGLAAGTAIAWMRELHDPQDAEAASQKTVTLNIFGLGLGPLLSGLLAAFAPFTMTLSYVVFISLLILLAVGIAFTQETVRHQHSLSEVSFRPRVGVPRHLRAKFIAPAIAMFVTFSLVGFYSVITPNLLTKTLRLHSLAIIGAVVFELFLTGAIATYAAFKFTSLSSMLTGMALMPSALELLIVSQQIHSFTTLLVATALGGTSVGLAYRGVLAIANQIAPPERRAEMVSALFIIGNLSLAIPVIGVGVLATLTSQGAANMAFAFVVGLFALAGLWLGKSLRA